MAVDLVEHVVACRLDCGSQLMVHRKKNRRSVAIVR